jgi:hypothetical protein
MRPNGSRPKALQPRGLRREPVTEPIARQTAHLLADAGLHGHRYAMLATPGPVTILASDPEDLTALCSGQVAVIKI